MEFKQAYEALKQGHKVKREHWAGYWKQENGTIKMFCKDGKVLDIRETQDVDYTITNMLQDDWVIVPDNIAFTNDIISTFTFGEAIRKLKNGRNVARKNWNGKGMYLELQTPDEHSKMTRPYIYMILPKGSTRQFGNEAKDIDRIPWTASQTDMLAEDWHIVE